MRRPKVARFAASTCVGVLTAMGWCAMAFSAEPGYIGPPYHPNQDTSVPPAGVYKNDSRHSTLTFTGQHYGGISSPRITFRQIQAEYTWDPKNPEASKVKALIPFSHIEAGDRDFEVKMNSPGYLFPYEYKKGDPRHATFTSTSIKFKDKTHGVMVGDLNFFGQTQPLTIEFVYNGYHDPKVVGYHKMGFSGKGTMKRSLWGMANSKYIPTFSDDMTFIIEMEFHGCLKDGGCVAPDVLKF